VTGVQTCALPISAISLPEISSINLWNVAKQQADRLKEILGDDCYEELLNGPVDKRKKVVPPPLAQNQIAVAPVVVSDDTISIF
jgi:hypothetical protein